MVMVKQTAYFMILALASLTLITSDSNASAGLPYHGVLRGWENEEGINERAYDIAVDDQYIYIAGEYFNGEYRYGPSLLIVSRDHTTLLCQRALIFNVAELDRWGALSLDINQTHVAVAGYYGLDSGDVIFLWRCIEKTVNLFGSWK